MVTAPKTDFIAIEFPGATPAEAAILAQECASKLREAGIDATSIKLARSEQEAMDLGGVLLILGGLGFSFIQEAAKGIGWEIGKAAGRKTVKAIEKLPVAIADVLEFISKRNRTAIQVKGMDGKTWTIGPEFQSALQPGKAGVALKTLGIVILGASEFPYMNDATLNNEAFARSAELAKTLFSPPHTAFTTTEVLDLFDKDMQPLEVLDAIEQHIDTHPDMHDLLIYYCGHGSFQKDRTYFLLLRSTRAGRESVTGFAPRTFRQDLELRLIDKRVYFVVDCCFSGAFVESLQSTALDKAIEEQLTLDMPQRGWTVLSASSKDKVAMAPKGETYTMFTGALAHVIQTGTDAAGVRFNFRDLADATEAYVKRHWKRQAVMPRCLSPEQPEGDVARLPIFLNKYQPKVEGDAQLYRTKGVARNAPFSGNTAAESADDLSSLKEKRRSHLTRRTALINAGLGAGVIVVGGLLTLTRREQAASSKTDLPLPKTDTPVLKTDRPVPKIPDEFDPYVLWTRWKCKNGLNYV